MLILFGATIFVGAGLLFLIQPMFARMALPLLGGAPAVWNTAMVFYQAVLLAGYAYAHVTTRWLGARRQAALHLAVLLLPREDLNRIWVLRKVLNPLSPVEAVELLLDKLRKTNSNADFLSAMQKMS